MHSPRNIIGIWGDRLQTLQPPDFTAIVNEMVRLDSTPFPDINNLGRMSLLNLQHFCYGEWQSSHELSDCLEAFAKLYNIDISEGHILPEPAIGNIKYGRAIEYW